MRVLIAVTHLLGTGHLSRALTLAKAFDAAGHDVRLMSGGMPVANFVLDGVELFQLPPVKSDGVNFTTLLGADDKPVTEAYLQNRITEAVSAVKAHKPDILITELFPFGRRTLRREFGAVLEAAETLMPRPVILSSIRDILAPPSKPEKAEKTREVIDRYYDGVLVHSDPDVVSLEASWPVSQDLSEKLLYTGFVAPLVTRPDEKGLGTGEILVTAGGGSVGDNMYVAAVKAAALMPERKWRLLVGGSDQDNRIETLKRQVRSSSITIEPTRPDFRSILANADAAVSMCGYNTAMDLLQTGVPAVLVPFDAGGEVEQTLRAESLSKSNQFSVVKAGELSAKKLVQALSRLQKTGPQSGLNFDGAYETVRIAERLRGAVQ